MFSGQDTHLYKENPLKHHTEDWHLREADYRKNWNEPPQPDFPHVHAARRGQAASADTTRERAPFAQNGRFPVSQEIPEGLQRMTLSHSHL